MPVPETKDAKLEFKRATSDQDIQQIYEYTIDAFVDFSPESKWSIREIKNEVNDGWQLYGVFHKGKVISALFLKLKGDALLTKNTAIEQDYQGSGFSHRIKEFYEQQARAAHLTKIVHYCAIDDFRMYSLNESHGYHKTDRHPDKHGLMTEWVRDLTDGFVRKKD